jgi:predicted negative regulator of RcsB-dependent stress response
VEEYVSESQQIEQLKRQAAENGPWLLAGVALAALAVFGYGQWQRWQESKLLRASARYGQVLESLAKDDRPGAVKLADGLRADYARTPYADQADLAVARALVEADDLNAAETRLEAVVRDTTDDALRVLARYRLARVQRAADRGDRGAAVKFYTTAAGGIADGLVSREALEMKLTALGAALPADATAGGAAGGVRP